MNGSCRAPGSGLRLQLGATALALAALIGGGDRKASAQARVVRGPLVHAHNCYPDEGKWADRIERALKLGLSQVAIEQDLAWVPASGGRAARSVVSHTDKPTGAEPTLDEHFFARVRPIMEKALADNQRERWPLMVLHLDFKTNETEHHQFVWDLLKRHERWLTTATKGRSRLASHCRSPPGPLLVLTENGTGQEADFSDAVAAGGRLLLFGTTPSPQLTREEDPDRRAKILAAAQPAVLVPWQATNYRRWTNFAWNVIEEGGQPKAGDVDGGRRRAPERDRQARARPGAVGSLLHAQRPPAGIEPGLDRRATTSARPRRSARGGRRRSMRVSTSSRPISTKGSQNCSRKDASRVKPTTSFRVKLPHNATAHHDDSFSNRRRLPAARRSPCRCNRCCRRPAAACRLPTVMAPATGQG